MNAFTPLESPASVVPILAQISFFGGVTDAQRDAIFRRMETGTFKKGAYVVQAGDEPTHLYIVRSGCVEVRVPDPEHGIIIGKQRHGVGECFGYVALMSMHKHTISAVALEDSEIVVLSRRALHGLHREDVELFAILMMNLAREMARLLRFTNEMLLTAWQSPGQGKGAVGGDSPVPAMVAGSTADTGGGSR